MTTHFYNHTPFQPFAPSGLSEGYTLLREALTQQLADITAQAYPLAPESFQFEALPQLSEDALASLYPMAVEDGLNRDILICQWQPIVGHIAHNTAIALAAMQQAEALGASLLLFPEGFLFGYPMRDLITRYPWKVDQQTEALTLLAKASGKCRVLLGCVEPNPDWHTCRSEAPWRANPKRFFNSVAVLGEGQLLGVVRKHAMATYQQYDDERVFEPSQYLGVLPAMVWGKGQTHPEVLSVLEPLKEKPLCLTLPADDEEVCKHIAVLVCEDAWRFPEGALKRYQEAYASTDTPTIDLVCNLSASVGREAKQTLRRKLLQCASAATRWPLLYVNQVGAMDECVFDGDSQLWGAVIKPQEAQELWRAGAYAPAMVALPWSLIHSPTSNSLPVPLPPIPSGEVYESYVPEVLPEALQAELARCFVALRVGIQTYFKHTGHRRAVLGMSGGLDSAVTAALLVLSLGPENVLMVSMPSKLTPQTNQADVMAMAKALGCTLLTLPMAGHTEATLQAVRQAMTTTNTQAQAQQTPAWQWEPEPVGWSTAGENVQAIQRATMLRLLANDYQALPIATSDKSEFYLGYATVNGDMSGALTPLGDVTKTKTRALGRWINQHTATLWQWLEADGLTTVSTLPTCIIPPAMVERPSGADLAINPATGKLMLAEEALMPYAFADECIWRTEVKGESLAEMLQTPFWLESHGGCEVLGAQKQAWLEKFFKRVQGASFKWWVAPPMLLCDRLTSLGSNCYHHPILSRL